MNSKTNQDRTRKYRNRLRESKEIYEMKKDRKQKEYLKKETLSLEA